MKKLSNRPEAANFIEIKCEPIGNDADIQSLVKSEPIEEDVLKWEPSISQDDEIENCSEFQNISNEAAKPADDGYIEYEECDVKFDGEWSAKLWKHEWTTSKLTAEVMYVLRICGISKQE